ncbi:MAG TPA: GNAT family N-acetyltransferase [Candidatus Binataceae bacterium]|nr:GNAT family N-acetyltransferase [Candidatus Binataceae bacterium]
MEERDLAEADRIMRMAFGSFIGLADPMTMFGDADMARTRFRAAPDGALVAEIDDKLVGSNFAANWGSFGYFGPLSVDPSLWNQGLAKQLLEQTMELFARWGCRHTGLYTFSDSAKHIALYQKFGFWPRYLTAVMSKPTQTPAAQPSYLRFSTLSAAEKELFLDECRSSTSGIYDGLDVSPEIRSVDQQHLGDTVLLLDGSRVSAFAVCHAGANSEAGSKACYAKFGAVRPGPKAAERFAALLEACEDFAAARQVGRLIAGVNMGRSEAYKVMLRRGYRIEMTGIAMHRENDPGYCRPDVYVLDDWR